MLDHASSMTSSPSIPDENIDFDSVYALHAFVATVEGQATANKGDALLLMEDENTYWWLVEVLHSGEIGYIPAENIETPYERLARLNKHRNVDITTPIEEDFDLQRKTSAMSILSRKQSKNLFVEFGPPKIIEFEPETEEDEEYDGDDDEYQWEDMDDSHRYYDQEYEEDYQEQSIQSCSQQLNVLRIFAGNIKQGTGFKTVMVTQNTTAQELVKQAMVKFHIEELESGANQTEYYATVKGIDGHESTLDPEDKPLSIYQTLTAHLTTPMPSVEHIKRLSNTQIHDSVIRFYLHRRTKRNSERVEQMYIKISLFLERKKYQTTMAEDANRVDKIICVNMNDLVSEVIYLALDKFHITNGVPDGPQENGYIPEDLVRYRLLVQSQGSG
ncbi:hypothetical protein BGW37DRAFT_431363 [Umbelopsis sp. PMI_123]|nr:hypothetical protein BGW37DRAFT_431363 [Umbelopsis sp. PMI_123]